MERFDICICNCVLLALERNFGRVLTDVYAFYLFAIGCDFE